MVATGLTPLATDAKQDASTAQGTQRRWVLPVIAVMIVAAVAGGVIVALSSGGHIAVPPRSTTPPAPTSEPSPTPTTVPRAEQQVARLAALLAKSAAQRQQVLGATSEIANCGDVQGAENSLRTSAMERQSDLNQLASIKVAAIPNGAQMKYDLTQAWTASIASDDSYASWAADELRNTNGCVPNDYGDSNYAAAQPPNGSDATATQFKSAFLQNWNALASQFDVPTYTAEQI